MVSSANGSCASDVAKGHTTEVQTTQAPLGRAGVPYVISSQDGEIIYIPLSKSATRLLITGKESDDAFAVVASGGSQSDPIGFHYHREAHDVFLALSGSINVWAGDQCRTMTEGDFASVPPVR
jgi:quercetin dioxygenase-like cupin family protein